MKYPNVNIADGLNLNPVPLEFSQSLTTTKWLGGIESKLNDLIDFMNGLEINSQVYTDEQVQIIQSELNKYIEDLKSGNFLEDASIDISKLKPNFLQDLEKIVTKYVRNSATFVTFGIDEEGYFSAYIPDSWDNVDFETDEEGRLVLNMY